MYTLGEVGKNLSLFYPPENNYDEKRSIGIRDSELTKSLGIDAIQTPMRGSTCYLGTLKPELFA